ARAERPAPGSHAGRPYEVTDADADVVPVLSLSREVTVVDPGVGEPSLRALVERTGARCSILVPLFSDEEFVGVAAAEYLVPPRTDPRADAALHDRLRGIANQAVVALQGAWLLEQVGPLAWHDSLTGLPNRRLLEHRAHRALEQTKQAGETTTVFFVDLDRFKRVNDTYGHATGDALIRQVAQRLRQVVRRQDTVARLGGDEFAVVLPGLADDASVREMASRMLDALRVPYRVDGNELHASASIGIALCPDHGEGYDELLIHADEAMYRSKGLGRDTFTMFVPDAGPGGHGPAPLDPDIHHAVERKELFVVYQPTVDLLTNRVVGVEALVRWRHPVRGVLEPAEFLALAEESEVIIGIDEFVLQEVARQVREWTDAGASPVRVSINASRRDLAHPRFADTVLSALRAHRLPTDLLEIEITEDVGAERGGAVRATVERLRAAGVRFAVDDFGAGSCSLQQVASLPARTLKIDRSLVQLVGPADELGPLASAIIAVAAELGMECVAEGVETLRQRQSLLQRGCTTAQGYLYGRPLPPDGVRRLLQPPPAAAATGPAPSP
ncbi:MAG: putative bifunctional diguanylate cyclase/phosphodiesterase, partial [Acidimicrobiales bacterium]